MSLQQSGTVDIMAILERKVNIFDSVYFSPGQEILNETLSEQEREILFILRPLRLQIL